MRLLLLISVLFLSACSVQVIDMTENPTVQKFDLNDPEADGVISARDECPASYSGAQVNNTGCGTETVQTARYKLEVNFETNSYVVNDEYLPEIEQLADFMNEFPATNVTIEGHTSIRGSVELNKTLSQNRAQTIKDILIQTFSIADERIIAIGYGFDRLLLEGDDESIHARNRRIVAEISSNKIFRDMKWNIYSVDKELE